MVLLQNIFFKKSHIIFKLLQIIVAISERKLERKKGKKEDNRNEYYKKQVRELLVIFHD